jgi:pilus assembly protein CpaB
MTSSIRLSIIMVLVLATVALGFLAYNAMLPQRVEPVAQAAPAAPVAMGYLVAARPLRVGTLAHEEDFKAARPSSAPGNAIPDTPKARAELRGAMVRNYLNEDQLVTLDDVLRPRDRGFIASVLDPDKRAISIKVDPESGVSGLIWPGDFVDVVLTQANDKADSGHRSLSETVLQNVRIIAIDQEIAEGAPSDNAAAGKATQTVSLEVTPEEVKRIAVAKELGRLSLAIRSAKSEQDSVDSGTMFGCHVSPEIARQSAVASKATTVVVYAGDKSKEFSVQKHGAESGGAAFGCGTPSQTSSRSDAMVSLSGK